MHHTPCLADRVAVAEVHDDPEAADATIRGPGLRMYVELPADGFLGAVRAHLIPGGRVTWRSVGAVGGSCVAFEIGDDPAALPPLGLHFPHPGAARLVCDAINDALGMGAA